MPARRRAPQGGRLANIRLPLPRFRQNFRLETLPQNVKLLLHEPLRLSSIRYGHGNIWAFESEGLKKKLAGKMNA
jgi:hypothetical protein